MMGSVILAAILGGGSLVSEPTPLGGKLPLWGSAKEEVFYRDARGKQVPAAEGVRWNNVPTRITQYWRGTGGLLFCDDPECLWCADSVYGRQMWPEPPVQIRR